MVAKTTIFELARGISVFLKFKIHNLWTPLVWSIQLFCQIY